jgi:hypothetical protein
MTSSAPSRGEILLAAQHGGGAFPFFRPAADSPRQPAVEPGLPLEAQVALLGLNPVEVTKTYKPKHMEII